MAGAAKPKGATPLQLCIGNVGEFYKPHLQMLGEHAKKRWRSSALQVSGAALFWNIPKVGSNVYLAGITSDSQCGIPKKAAPVQPGRVVVLPARLDEELILELDERLGLGGVEVIVPAARGGLLSRDLLCDQRALRRIEELALAHGAALELAAWGETEGLCELIEGLERRGIKVHSSYGRHGNLLKTAQLDSKAGLRRLAEKLSGGWTALLPEGEVVEGKAASGKMTLEAAEGNAGYKTAGILGEAATTVQRMAPSGAVVVKAALSTSGVGQVRIEQGRYTIKELTRRLEFAARAFPELTAWPLVVERWHFPPETVEHQGEGHRYGGYCAQCVADGVGGASVLFTAAHGAADEDGAFTAALGRRAVGSKRAAQIEALARALGGELSGWGYSGVFGIDLVVDEGGGLKLVEINARRTTLSAGGELLKLTAAVAAGDESHPGVIPPKGKEEGVVLFYERLAELPASLGWQEQKRRLSKLLFPIDGRPEGWVPLPVPVPVPTENPDGRDTQTPLSGFAVATSLSRAVEVARAVQAALEGE